MKIIIKIKHKYFEYDSCSHEEEEQIGLICNSFNKDGNRIEVDGVIIEIPPYHEGLDIDLVSKFWWEDSLLTRKVRNDE